MKVLITGGAGFLGRRLAKRLLQKGVLKNAEGEEEKILRAAHIIADEKIAKPILLGSRTLIR